MKIEIKSRYSDIVEIEVSVDNAKIQETFYYSADVKKLLFDALDGCFDGYRDFAEYLLKSPQGDLIREFVIKETEKSE